MRYIIARSDDWQSIMWPSDCGTKTISDIVSDSTLPLSTRLNKFRIASKSNQINTYGYLDLFTRMQRAIPPEQRTSQERRIAEKLPFIIDDLNARNNSKDNAVQVNHAWFEQCYMRIMQ